MSKIANMLNMIDILKDNKVHSIKELSKKLEVSTRMIRVYKNELEQAGIYINGIKGIYGGYIIDTSLNNIDVGLTFDELKILDKIIITNEQKEIIPIIQKINSAYHYNSNKQAKKKLINLKENNQQLLELYLDMRYAINNNIKAWIEFKSINSGTTKRIIHPSELFSYLDDWYLGAFCELRNEIRLFKLSDILKYKILNESYDYKNK